MGNRLKLILSMLALALSTGSILSESARAETREYMAVRWTADEDKNADLSHILDVIKQKTADTYEATSFKLFEDRPMATLRFRQYLQTSGGTPIRSASIRIWSQLGSNETIMVEAVLLRPAKLLALDRKAEMKKMTLMNASQNTKKLQDIVKAAIADNAQKAGSDDTEIHSQTETTFWSDGEVVREYKVRGRRGEHKIVVSLERFQVVTSTYSPFPQADLLRNSDSEFSVQAKLYPIYEEPEGESGQGVILDRENTELKYLKKSTMVSATDPFLELKKRKYYEPLYDEDKGNTEEGRDSGYWSMTWLKKEIARIQSRLSSRQNSYSTGGVVLDGRYATINIHPEAWKNWGKKLKYSLQYAPQMKLDWQVANVSGMQVYELVPLTGLLNRPFTSAADFMNRQARRLADNNPAEYINDGFDELQVYYSINRLMDALHKMGFTDPELSTRRFDAYLYDPDIAMRDNAYYTNDTINFTTYTPSAPNYARDNTTIWHELGHGVMDRLMGDLLHLADTGGLSEGMADFVAALVVADVTGGKAFRGGEKLRIVNNTNFHMTSEAHDDGEAYGGSMKDILDAAMTKWGRSGLHKMADLTLQTMRLSRNHPALTAEGWFSYMILADKLGRNGVREKGEMTPLILTALAGRNFDLDGGGFATFTVNMVKDDGSVEEIKNQGNGSRAAPIKVTLKESETAGFKLRAKVASSKSYQFQYPVTVKVQLREGPLQGSVHWVGEEQQPLVFSLKSEQDEVELPLSVSGKCDDVNLTGNRCADYAYLEVFNGASAKPVAKKRFYVIVNPK